MRVTGGRDQAEMMSKLPQSEKKKKKNQRFSEYLHGKYPEPMRGGGRGEDIGWT